MKKMIRFSPVLKFVLRALCVFALGFVGLSSLAVLPSTTVFDPIAAVGGGSAYSIGDRLTNQICASGAGVWTNANTTYSAGGGTNFPTVASGNLSKSGLVTSTGNSIRFGGVGGASRFCISGSSQVTATTVYFSFLMKCSDLRNIDTGSGAFIAGLNNSVNVLNAGQPTVIMSRIILKTNSAAADSYFIGTGKEGTAANWAFSATPFGINDTVFVVGSHTLNTGTTTDDVSKLWINPDQTTFGAASAPAADLTSSGGTDPATGIGSFVLFNRAGTPTNTVMDEMRFGMSWASVTPGVAPSITAQPISVTNVAGSTATFTVTASGTANLAYQWKKNGGDISSATTSSLTLASVSGADEASYTAVVTNVFGTATSSAATFVLLTAPAITTQPVATTVNAGTTATFNVVSSGLFKLYQWRSNGLDLANGGNVSGATSATLTLANALKAYEATYTVQVTNDAGFVVSDGAATLTVIDPAVNTQPVSLTRNAGQSATFSVGAGGTDTVTYQWRLNGVNIPTATDSSYIIGSVTDSDVGSYDVGVTNGFGGVLSSVATLTVVNPPVIDTNPSSLTIGAGTNATFSVASHGTSPSYQWRKGTSNLSNGGRVSGATTSNLTIAAATASDIGSYNVVLANSAATISSSDAVLTVIDPPVITLQPHNVAVTTGGTTNFSVTATGTSPSYQWQKGGVNVTDGGAFSGATTSSLTVTGATASEEGTYHVILSNAAAAITSSDVTLTAAAAPVITTQPTNSAVNANGTAYFSVVATGADPLSYQWRFDSGSGPTDLMEGGVVAGSTSATLTLTGVYAANAGSYFVVITNTIGSATSSSGTLTVTDPIIDTQPSSISIGAGSNAVFTVSATGTPTLTYQWKKGASNLSNGGNILGATSASLTVIGISQLDADSYSVVVSGVGSQTSSAATLTVFDPPVISSNPSSQTVNATTTVNLGVSLSQGTSPTYQWRKGGVNLSNGGRISGATTATLTVTGALFADNGSYSIVVANLAGSATSSDAILTVNDPVITAQPQSSTKATGSTATFSVTATGTATITYQWQKNGSNLSNGGNVSGATTATLSLTLVTNANDAASYTVIVSGAGSPATSSTATLTVMDAPAITTSPANFQTFVSSNIVLNVVATGPSLSYIWRKYVTNILSDGGSIFGATTANLSLSNLQFSDAGNYSVIVSNAVGTKTSSTAVVAVFANFPLIEPFNYSAGNLMSNLAPNNLQWFPVGTNGTENLPDVLVTNINLSYTGLSASSGKAVRFKNIVSGSLGVGGRLQIGPDQSTGTMYYSFLFKAEDITSLATTATGIFIAGFNNSTNSQNTIPTTVGPRLYVRKSGSGYFIGLAKNDSIVNYDTTLRSTNDTVMIVASYSFNSGTTSDDTAAMWINPDSGTFGQGTEPTPTLTQSSGVDIQTVRSFVILQRNSTQPNTSVMDELRIGQSWADVTPAAPVTITSQPSSRTNAVGTTATLTATISGAETITYQWRKNGVDLSNGGNVSGANTASLTLSNVQTSDAASYSLFVTNRLAMVTSSDAVLHISPGISSQPSGQSVNYGSSVTFNVVASGEPTLTYQWIKGGVNVSNGGTVSGATSDTLSITGTVGADSGSYTVVVSNTYGTTTSTSAALAVADPVITSQPSNVEVGTGTNAVFSVVAQGTSLSYQWNKNGSPLSNSSHISGATSATLTIVGAVSADADSYSVDVTGATVLGSSMATLTVGTPPSILSQPQSITNSVGSTAIFSVSANGTSPTYQWSKGGSPLSNGGNVSGATSATLTLSSVAGTDVGSYSVHVSNSAGSADSDAAILTVNDPIITAQPISETTNAGATVVFGVTVTGSGVLTYQWQREGVNLIEGATNAAGGSITGTTSATLTLANVAKGQETNYHVVVTGASTITSSTATLAVTDPYILTNPTNTMIVKGTTNVLTVVAAGTPTLKYQWYFKANAITTGQYVKQVGKTNATLTIGGVTGGAGVAAAGDYFVTVSNQYSRFAYPGIQAVGNYLAVSNVATSMVAHVTINLAPTVSNPANLTKIRGNDAIFRVTATGTTPISYHWKTNGVELSNIPDKIIGADTAVLTIKDVQGTDVGVANLPNPSGVLPATVSYQCTVSNASLLTATSSGTMGNLTVTEDTLNPLSLISHPITTYLFRLTNGLSKTTNFVTNPSGDVKTAPDVTIDGLAIDAGRIADVSITQKYYDTNGVQVTMSPVSVALYGSLPGFKKWTNDFVLRDGTNIFTAIATDSAGNVQTRLIPKKYFLVRTAPLTVTLVKGDGIGEGTTEPGRLPAVVLGFGQASNLASLEIGRGYQIKAVPSQNCIVTNWTDGGDIVRGTNGSYASLTLTFLMQEGLELKANFMTNPIIAANVAGLYNGVFNEESGGLPAVTEETSGSMLNVTVRSNRLVIAPINIQGRGHTLVGFLNQDGDLTKTIDRSVFGRSNLVVSLHLDWANNTKQMTGTISSTNSAAVPWSASFTNDLAGLYLSQDDRYTLAIPPTATSHLAVPNGTPGGYGYAMITNDATGKMLFTGKTADGTAITQVGPVSKDGKAPIHINLYPVTGYPFRGILHGWLDFTSGAPVGTLNWIKQGASAFPTNYPDGFTNLNVAVLGSLYDPNAYGSGRALNLSSGTFSVSDCNVGSDTDLTWTFGLSTANVITRTGGPATNSLSGSIVKSLGLMSVTFRPTGLPATGVRSIKGIVLQNTSSGYGAFNGNTNQTGSATLAP